MKKILLFAVIALIYLSGFSQYQVITPLTPLTTPTGSTTVLSIPASLSPAGGGTITLYYQGDFDGATETGDLFDENNALIGTTLSGVSQCSPTLDSVKFPVTASQISSWVLDGIIGFNFTITNQVNPTLCTTTGDNVQVKLEYPPVLGPNDIGAVNIGIGSGAAFCSGSQPVTTTISNAGTNQVTTAIVNWEINGVAQTPVNFTGLLDTLGGTGSRSAVVNLGNVVFTSGITNFKVYTSMPNGVTDTSNVNDTTYRSGGPSLSGAFTINAANPTAGTNFNSFFDLTSALNSTGICGPVTVNVSPGNYLENVLFGSITGSSSINTITIDGGDSSTTIINGSTGFYSVAFEGASHITVQNMGIVNLNTTSQAVLLGNNSSNNTIENCNIRVSTNSVSSVVNPIGTSNSLTTRSTNAQAVNNNTIQNNRIIGGYYGVYFYGGSGNLHFGNRVLNNQIDSSYYYGVYGYYVDQMEVSENEMDLTIRNNVNADGIYGLYNTNGIFERNKIHVPDYGFYISNTNAVAGPTTRKTVISNNMIISEDDYGMYLNGVDSVNIFHNSILTKGGFATSSPAVYLLGSATYEIADYDVRNNIFYAYNSEAFETGAAVPDTIFSKMDNNIFYSGGVTTINIAGTSYANVSAYRTASPQLNTASIQGDPLFVSPSSLYLVGALANDVGDNSVGVLIDIDGESRPSFGSTFVDIGADEYNPPTCLPITNLSVSNAGVDSVTISWNGSGNTYQYGIVFPGSSPTSGITGSTNLSTIRVGGLTTSTAYQVYVREVCGRGDTSIWIGPINFSTTCVLSTLPFNEGFSSQFPVCWTRTNSTDVFTTTGCGGSINESLQLFGVAGSFAETPPISVSGSGIVDVRYLYRKGLSTDCGETADAGDNINVEYWDGANWNVVKNYDGSTAPTVFTQDSFSINVSGFTGPLKVRFFYVQGSGVNFDNYNFENLSITQPPASDNLEFVRLVNPSISNDSCYGSSEDVIVNLLNAGGTILDFTTSNATITVNVTGATTQTLSATINSNAANGGAPLAIGNSINVNMGSINMSTAGIYDFDGLITMVSDTFPLDDSLSATLATMPAFAGVISGIDTICDGDTTTLTATSYQGELQWQKLISGVWTNIAGETSSSIEVSPLGNTDYRVMACGSSTSNVITVVPIIIPTPSVSSNVAVVACGSIGTDTLIASSMIPGANFKWYDAIVGGNLVHSGDSLLFSGTPGGVGTPSIDSFYVSASIGGSGGTVQTTPHVSVFSGNARGYHFVAPVDFTITGLEVGVQAGTGSQNVAVLKTNANAPWNLWSAGIVPFTTLFLSQNSAVTGYIPCNIPIKAGDVIAILGQRGGGNSYGTASNITIEGMNVPIQRFIMQNPLASTAPANATQMGYEASANISNVNFTYLGGCEGNRVQAIAEINCLVGVDNSELISDFNISPNPSNGEFIFNVSTITRENIYLTLRNVNGKEIYNDNLIVTGELSKNLDFTSFSKGVYFLQIQSGDKSRVEKLIIK